MCRSGRCLLAPVPKAVAILVLAMASGCHSPSDTAEPIGFQFATHDCPPSSRHGKRNVWLRRGTGGLLEAG